MSGVPRPVTPGAIGRPPVRLVLARLRLDNGPVLVGHQHRAAQGIRVLVPHRYRPTPGWLLADRHQAAAQVDVVEQLVRAVVPMQVQLAVESILLVVARRGRAAQYPAAVPVIGIPLLACDLPEPVAKIEAVVLRVPQVHVALWIVLQDGDGGTRGTLAHRAGTHEGQLPIAVVAVVVVPGGCCLLSRGRASGYRARRSCRWRSRRRTTGLGAR